MRCIMSNGSDSHLTSLCFDISLHFTFSIERHDCPEPKNETYLPTVDCILAPIVSFSDNFANKTIVLVE